jgi:hypothetical protein
MNIIEILYSAKGLSGVKSEFFSSQEQVQEWIENHPECEVLEDGVFIDLNSNNYYDFREGLEVMSTGKLSVKSYHTNKFEEDLEIGTKVIAGWSAKKSHQAIITDIIHEFYDCGTTRYTFYKVRRIK